MPLEALINPEDMTEVALEDAPRVFDEAGVMPAAAVQAILEDEQREHTLPVVNPSGANPLRNCRREVLLKKYVKYKMSPLTRWAAIEGGFWHNFLADLSAPGWKTETYLPDQAGADDEHPNVRVVMAPWGKEIRQLEVFPGWWARTKIDLVAPDWSEIVDYKTGKYPWGNKPKAPPYLKYENEDARDIWPVQLSLEARFIEMLRGVTPGKLWIWRKFNGSRVPEYTFRKIPIRRIQPEPLWNLIGEHVLSLQGWLEEAETSNEPLEVARKAPPDGMRKNMFGGWKCNEGCPVRAACNALEGLLEF